jgi:hypothetical protein
MRLQCIAMPKRRDRRDPYERKWHQGRPGSGMHELMPGSRSFPPSVDDFAPVRADMSRWAACPFWSDARPLHTPLAGCWNGDQRGFAEHCQGALLIGVLTQGSSPGRRKQLTIVARGGNRYTHRRASPAPFIRPIIIL